MSPVLAKGRAGGKNMISPSELPIYDEQTRGDEYEYYTKPPGMVQQTVCSVRLGVSDFLGQYRGTFERAQQFYETGKAHSAASLDYLTDESNVVPRAAAITLGGLTGLLLAALRRRGLFKRLLYTTVGLAVPTTVCYPDQAASYTRWSYDEAKKYSVIAYNFLVGAKPEQLGAKPVAPVKEAVQEAAASVQKRVEASPVKPAPSAPAKTATEQQVPQPPQVAVRLESGDPGQANPEDADLYTTRSG